MKDTHRLAHFVKVYDDVIKPEACDDIIGYYKTQNHEQSGVEDIGVLNKARQADEVNVSVKSDSQSKQIHNFLIEATKTVMAWYYQDVKEYAELLPPITEIESFRLKHYDKEKGYYKTHIDNVGGRQFAVIFYLNTVETGGETEFPLMKTKVTPKQGRVLIFPTTFMYPHSANVPVSSDKFMIQGYIIGK